MTLEQLFAHARALAPDPLDPMTTPPRYGARHRHWMRLKKDLGLPDEMTLSEWTLRITPSPERTQ
jgi:hypothetical protein